MRIFRFNILFVFIFRREITDDDIQRLRLVLGAPNLTRLIPIFKRLTSLLLYPSIWPSVCIFDNKLAKGLYSCDLSKIATDHCTYIIAYRYTQLSFLGRTLLLLSCVSVNFKCLVIGWLHINLKMTQSSAVAQL